MQDEQVLTKPGRTLGIIRASIGLLQELALYFLFRQAAVKAWPATDAFVFVPLLLVAGYVPLIALLGAGAMRLRTLLPYLVLAAATIAALGYYDVWRAGTGPGTTPLTSLFYGGYFPTARVILFTGLALFAVHALIASAEADRKWIATYPTHFDIGWKLALQLQLALGFAGALWLLLFLGARLFLMIGIAYWATLITKPVFIFPVTTLAIAAALHLSDVRSGLVRGMRTLVLTVNAWLLPVMTLFAVGFLASLFMRGLDPLWATRWAASLLLGSAAALILLINTAYQDGLKEHLPPAVLRVAATAAALSLAPLCGLAAYALYLRVRQYGWTDDRIVVAAIALVGSVYALGYAAAALTSLTRLGPWLKRLEPTNVVACFAGIATLLALLSPLVDPARLSVASQIARLQSGEIAADKFDYA